MLSAPDLDRLRDRLHGIGYTVDPVLERLGTAGRRGLERNSTKPARDAVTGGPDDALGSLIRLWILQDAVDQTAIEAALGAELTEALLASGLVHVEWPSSGRGDRAASGADRVPSGSPGKADGGGDEDGADRAVSGSDRRSPGSVPWAGASDRALLRAAVSIRPYGAEAGPTDQAISGWICHDLLPNLDGRNGRPHPSHVLGVSPASSTLAQLTIRRPVGRALDLGTGCGVQSLHLAAHAKTIVATDLNPRALELARLTTRLSGVDADLRLGSLYEPVADESFDLIVSNPPFVISPPGERLVYREGDLPGDELVRRVIVDGAARLAPEGTMQVLCNWAILRGTPWDERLGRWLAATGCDALVLQREVLDPYEYIEMWLSDAGLDASPEHAAKYADWLAYFDQLGIEGVGMGWVSVRNAGRATPHLRIESWPYDVQQPVGDAFAAQQSAVDESSIDDDALLDTRWRVHPGVVQETMGRPGAADPEHIVLRQGFGLSRATEVDTPVAALVGACDGELPARAIIGAVASLLDVDESALTAELTPRLRELVADGYLASS